MRTEKPRQGAPRPAGLPFYGARRLSGPDQNSPRENMARAAEVR